jgi:hypothetical protein
MHVSFSGYRTHERITPQTLTKRGLKPGQFFGISVDVTLKSAGIYIPASKEKAGKTFPCTIEWYEWNEPALYPNIPAREFHPMTKFQDMVSERTKRPLSWPTSLLRRGVSELGCGGELTIEDVDLPGLVNPDSLAISGKTEGKDKIRTMIVVCALFAPKECKVEPRVAWSAFVHRMRLSAVNGENTLTQNEVVVVPMPIAGGLGSELDLENALKKVPKFLPDLIR